MAINWDDVDVALPRLKKWLLAEMRKRGLLGASPAYLGFPHATWRDADAQEDLIIECYLFAVLQRRASLRAQAQAGKNIDGFIVRNVRNFLTSRQRKWDPEGYRIYRNVKATLQTALNQGRLTVRSDHEGTIDNNTLFLFPVVACPAANTVEDIRSALAGAADWFAARPALVRFGEEAQQVLAVGLERMAQAGIDAFWFRDLVDAVKNEVEAHLNARKIRAPVSLSPKGESTGSSESKQLDEQDSFHNLVKAVRRAIRQNKYQLRFRTKIRDVFEKLVELAPQEQNVSQAELARLLAMPTSTLNECIKVLRKIIQEILSRNPDAACSLPLLSYREGDEPGCPATGPAVVPPGPETKNSKNTRGGEWGKERK